MPFEPLKIETAKDVGNLLDHAILHPTTTRAHARDELEKIAALPLASVCIKPALVELAVQVLSGSDVKVGTVVGFPHGAISTESKVAETILATKRGCSDIDMVINVGDALGRQWNDVLADIRAVTEAAHAGGAICKVIFETDYIPDDAIKVRLCELCVEAGADFVKTSTGFGFVKQASGDFNYRGATENDVRIMRLNVPVTMGVKPSGGIRSLDDVLKFVKLGATRIGTGSAIQIMQQAYEKFGGAGAVAKVQAGTDGY